MRRPITSHWSEEQIAALRAMLKVGVTPLRAAAALGRSMVSVKAKARLLGSPFPTVAQYRKMRRAKVAAAKEPRRLDASSRER